MSDIMLLGVLNMPLPDDPAKLDAMTWLQFRGRAREAAQRIQAGAEALDSAQVMCDAYATENQRIADERDAAQAELVSFKANLLRDIEEPDDELLAEFQRAFTQQLQRRKHNPSLESAEKAGARAMFKLAVTRERKALPPR